MRTIFPTDGGAAFRSRNFRLYWSAQLISMMGTFMQSVALGYLVYDLTGSKLLLGVISSLQLGPSLLLSLPAGVVADRVPRRTLVLCTQTSAVLLAFALATLTALHQLQVWEILVISTLSGVAIAAESPARQALVAELVDRTDLPNAIGWNSLVMNGSRVLGPAIAGIAIRFVGVAPIFYYNSFSFLAMIAALLLLRLPPATVSTRPRHVLHEVGEGLRYVRHTGAVLVTLALLTLVAGLVMNYAVLMPIMARDELHVGAEGLGWMWAAMGLGAVAGSLTVVSRGESAVRGPLLLITAGTAGLSAAALGLSGTLGIALIALVAVGWSTGAFVTAANAAIQRRVPDVLRGRVLSVYSMLFAGTAPLGNLMVAWLASNGGGRLALVAPGLAALAGTVALTPAALRLLGAPFSTAMGATRPTARAG